MKVTYTILVLKIAPLFRSAWDNAPVWATARTLAHDPATISRELARNGWRNPVHRPRRRGRPSMAGGYRAMEAQQRAGKHAATPPRARQLVRGTRCGIGL